MESTCHVRISTEPNRRARQMTRREHSRSVAHHDLPDENLSDYLLQAEVVGFYYVSRRVPPGAAKLRRWIRSEARCRMAEVDWWSSVWIRRKHTDLDVVFVVS